MAQQCSEKMVRLFGDVAGKFGFTAQVRVREISVPGPVFGPKGFSCPFKGKWSSIDVGFRVCMRSGRVKK